jgi:hypothetical protein
VGSNPERGEIFRTRPDRPRGLPCFLHEGCRVFLGGKAAKAWRWPPTKSSTEVIERVDLYLYSQSGSSWFDPGQTLPLPYKRLETPNGENLKRKISWIQRVIRI